MIPTQQQDEDSRDESRHACRRRKVLISKHVIHAVGRPRNLHRLQVRHLWEDHYRVNILVCEDSASAKVAYSYFLVADTNGNILSSSPQIASAVDARTGAPCKSSKDSTLDCEQGRLERIHG